MNETKYLLVSFITVCSLTVRCETFKNHNTDLLPKSKLTQCILLVYPVLSQLFIVPFFCSAFKPFFEVLNGIGLHLSFIDMFEQ